MKLTLTILILACCGGLNLAQQEDLHEFIPIPRNNLTVDPTVIPIPRAGAWGFSLSPSNPVVMIRSINYPNAYPAGEDLKFFFFAPSGYTIWVSCDEVVLEASSGCTKDFISISPTGRTDFEDGIGFCGQWPYTYSQASKTNRLAFRFVSKYPQSSSPNNPFRFSCKVYIAKTRIPVTTAAPVTTTAAPVTTTSATQTTTAAPKTTTAAPTKTTTAAPATTAASSNSKANSTCTCGARNEQPRIVGGTYADENEFPWKCHMVVKRARGLFGCGASIIDEEWVLTAAHCLRDAEKVYVACGLHDTSEVPWPESEGSPYVGADVMISHPLYSSTTKDNDIALLLLPKPLVYSKTISPVCLPWQRQGNECKSPGTSVTASGWGTTAFQGQGSKVLKKVELPCMSSDQCRRSRWGSIITSNMICTHKPGEDTCQGDSGGSIDFMDPSSNRYYAIGVVSYGAECAHPEIPGVYTNVVNYLPWIKSITGKTFCGE